MSKEWLLVLQESYSSNCCNVLGYWICTCFNMPRAAIVTLFQITWFTEKNFPKFDIKSMGRCEAFKIIFWSLQYWLSNNVQKKMLLYTCGLHVFVVVVAVFYFVSFYLEVYKELSNKHAQFWINANQIKFFFTSPLTDVFSIAWTIQKVCCIFNHSLIPLCTDWYETNGNVEMQDSGWILCCTLLLQQLTYQYIPTCVFDTTFPSLISCMVSVGLKHHKIRRRHYSEWNQCLLESERQC